MRDIKKERGILCLGRLKLSLPFWANLKKKPRHLGRGLCSYFIFLLYLRLLATYSLASFKADVTFLAKVGGRCAHLGWLLFLPDFLALLVGILGMGLGFNF